MADRLLKLYEDILEYCSFRPNEKGEVEYYYVFDKESTKPWAVTGKGVLLPTKDNLKRRDVDSTLIFHPAQEAINRGESDIVKGMRHQLNVNINYVTLKLATGLMVLLGNTALHKEFTPEQRELLLSAPTADAFAHKRFTDAIGKPYAEAANRFFCNIYLKKAGKFKGETHSRVGIVQFPFFEFIGGSDLKLKKGDEELFSSVLEFIFPGSKDDDEAYNGFSDSRDAPWMDCLLMTSYNLTQRLNELLRLFGPYIDDYKDYLFNDSWVDGMANLSSYRDEIIRIPMQAGNSGEAVEAPAPKQGAVPAATIPTPAQTVESGQFMPAPKQAPAPAQAPAPQYPQMQQPLPVQCYDAYGRPVPPHLVAQQYQQQQAPMPAPGAGVAYTENGKVDFRSIQANNPAVALAGNVVTPLNQWQNQPPQMPQGYGYPPPMDPRIAPVGQPRFTGMAPGGYPQPPQGYGYPTGYAQQPQGYGYPQPQGYGYPPGAIVPI